MFESVAAVPGVKHVVQSHGTIAPIVRNPEDESASGDSGVDRLKIFAAISQSDFPLTNN